MKTELLTKEPSAAVRAASGKPEPPGTRKAKSLNRIPVHITGTTVPDCICQLVGIDAGVLYVRSEYQIPESAPIVVSFDHVQLSGVVADCQPHETDWIISVALASCKRRLEERVSNGESCSVGVVGSVGNLGSEATTLHTGTVVDQSPSGLGLRINHEIDTGVRVCVETASMMVFGEVRYCRQTRDGHFMAGVMIVEVAPDLHTQNPFSVMLNNLRWKLASSIRGKELPAWRSGPSWK